MRVILVVERKHLFPGLSPQGFLAPSAVNLEALYDRLFFAERDHMESNAHYKQIIPYLVLTRGQGATARVLAYQRRAKHTETRLGSLWSVGFGGHVEPLDRSSETVATAGLVRAAAVRELEEETGIVRLPQGLVLAGFINSDREDVSSVHFGVVFRVPLDDLPADDASILAIVDAQAEPHQSRWLAAGALAGLIGPGKGPDGGTFEDWSAIVIAGLDIR
jgi:predicted NUDIX family phosphoesterase